MLSVAQDSIVLNGGMAVNNTLKRVLKKKVVAAFEVSPLYSLQGIGENQEPQQGGFVSRPRFKQSTFWI
jgi:hypothetical protein